MEAWERRERKRESNRTSAIRRREKAVAALGGKCVYCKDDEFHSLHIIAIGSEAKKWSQVVFYKMVIEREDRKEFAKLLCGKCKYGYFNGKTVQEAIAYKEGRTGCFYDVAGQKVEQLIGQGMQTYTSPTGEKSGYYNPHFRDPDPETEGMLTIIE